MTQGPRLLFVTGKLAEPALRRTLDAIAGRAGFSYEVAVLPITVVTQRKQEAAPHPERASAELTSAPNGP